MNKVSIVRVLIGAAALVSASTTLAQPVRNTTLTVVYDSGETIDAVRFYNKRLREDDESKLIESVPPAPIRPPNPVSMEERLPLVSQKLKPGRASILEFQNVHAPFFIMGMDRQSLNWFEEAVSTLHGMGAVGFVVEASNKSDWLHLERFAKNNGVKVSLLNGSSLASMYGITTYPSVIINQRAGNE